MSSTLAPLPVLNRPETSLRPSLFAPLARLVAAVAEHSQVMVVTHANALAAALDAADLCTTYGLK